MSLSPHDLDHYEVRFETDPRTVSITAVENDGQFRLVAAEEFGPFDTTLEIAQWVWRRLTLDLKLTQA